MANSLLLPVGGTALNVKVHPVVLMQICDAYLRRSKQQERVIGTLLGVATDNLVQINKCYVVPHNESADQVAVDIVHHKTMFDLHQRVSTSQAIVGWFSSGSSINSSDALIQEFYTKEVASSSPVHLILDTTLAGDHVGITTYISRSLALGDQPLATEFVQVPCEVMYSELEKVGVDLMVSGDQDKGRQLADQDGLAASVERLQQLVARAQAYVDDVLAGKQKGDAATGRYLADTLAVVPHLAPESFKHMFNEGVQDDLLVSYFAHLVRSQVALGERLGTAMLPLVNI